MSTRRAPSLGFPTAECGGNSSRAIGVAYARTIAGHSPLVYKAYAAGNYAVNGVWPPANGYF
jgi:hypothetical protein